jgi:integrase
VADPKKRFEAEESVMKRYVSLVHQAEEYFAWKRKLGFRPRTERDEVLHFARRIDAARPREINVDTVVAWARDSKRGSARYIAHRYEAVRRFLARIAQARRGVIVPPPGYLGGRFIRARVHVYSQAEVHALMEAALTLPPVAKLRPHTWSTLFGLLDATGMRVGEAIELDTSSVDLREGTLLVRRDKSGHSRLLPIAPTTADALKAYSERRERRHKEPKSPAFFLTETRGTRLQYQYVNRTFCFLRRMLGWRTRPLPRVHDFRHTFAVRTFLDWIRAGKDVDVEMPALTAYLGHSKPESTYWYLSAVPELSHLITGNMERIGLQAGSTAL